MKSAFFQKFGGSDVVVTPWAGAHSWVKRFSYIGVQGFPDVRVQGFSDSGVKSAVCGVEAFVFWVKVNCFANAPGGNKRILRFRIEKGREVSRYNAVAVLCRDRERERNHAKEA